MNDGNVILLLNEKLDKEERFFKLSSVKVSGKEGEEIIHLVLLVPADKYDKYLDENKVEMPLRSKVYYILAELLPYGMTLKLEYKKSVTTDTQVINSVLEFIKLDSRLLLPKISAKDIDVRIVAGEYIEVTVSVSKTIYAFCQQNAFADRLKKFLDSQFIEDSEIVIKDAYEEESVLLADLAAPPQRLIMFDESTAVLGNVTRRAKYIIDVLELKKEIEKVAIAGVVKNLIERDRKTNDLKFFVFKLDDTTGTIDVKYFPKSEDAYNKFKKISEGDKVVVEGAVRYDDYSSAYAMILYAAAKIEVDFKKAVNDINYLPVPKNYFLVKPEAYEEEKCFENISLFEDSSVVDDVPDMLKGKTYVVFDTETTGLLVEDVIIELAAVKIVDGKMVETWQTFVKPKIPLTEKIMDITHITQEMVDSAPTFNKVVGDFYKFCSGCALVAHNAPFDMGMLNKMSRKLGYNFDNEVYDTLALARQFLPNLSRYKLEFLCEELDIKLFDAHRAINDAKATAQLFRKLCKKISM